MPKKNFYLDEQKSEKMLAEWGLNWKNFTITDAKNNMIGRIENVKELKTGKTFTLDDGRTLSVQLKNKMGISPELEILVNGIPAPGSQTDPRQQVQQSFYILLFLGIFNLAVGLLAELAQIDFLLSLGVGSITMIIGGVYLLLGYFVKYKHSLIALYTAIVLIAVDIVLLVAYAAESGRTPTTGIMIKILFIVFLAKGIQGVKKIRISQTGT